MKAQNVVEAVKFFLEKGESKEEIVDCLKLTTLEFELVELIISQEEKLVNRSLISEPVKSNFSDELSRFILMNSCKYTYNDLVIKFNKSYQTIYQQIHKLNLSVHILSGKRVTQRTGIIADLVAFVNKNKYKYTEKELAELFGLPLNRVKTSLANADMRQYIKAIHGKQMKVRNRK